LLARTTNKSDFPSGSKDHTMQFQLCGLCGSLLSWRSTFSVIPSRQYTSYCISVSQPQFVVSMLTGKHDPNNIYIYIYIYNIYIYITYICTHTHRPTHPCTRSGRHEASCNHPSLSCVRVSSNVTCSKVR